MYLTLTAEQKNNGTGLDPKHQAAAAHSGAFANLPATLDTWYYNQGLALEKNNLEEEKGLP
jgi:hypothetical protein